MADTVSIYPKDSRLAQISECLYYCQEFAGFATEGGNAKQPGTICLPHGGENMHDGRTPAYQVQPAAEIGSRFTGPH